MKKRKYQSEILMVIHQHNEALHRLGLVSDEEMRELDRDCLVPEAAAKTIRSRRQPAAPIRQAEMKPQPEPV